MAEENRAIDILAEILKDNDLNVSKTVLDNVSEEVRKVLSKWIEDANVKIEDFEDEVFKGSYFDDELAYYVFSFYNDDAEIYAGRVVIEEGPKATSLVGESTKGSE